MKSIPMRAAGAVLAAVLALGACAKNPVTGRTELSLISEQDEIAIGAQTRPEILQQFDSLYRDGRLQAYVSDVGNKVAAVGHRPNLPYSFEVLNSSEVNAFALPGGKVFITRGLLGRLSNEAQVAGVLGHEVGHVTAKHAVRSLSSAVLLQVPLLVGASYAEARGGGQGLLALGTVSAALLQLRFSRSHETESDRLGVEYSAKAGYDPQGMVQLLEVLKESQAFEPSKFQNMFQTHPLSAKRIEDARQLIARNYPDLESMNLAWNPERFEDAVASLRTEQRAYDTFDTAEAARNGNRHQDALQLYSAAIAQIPSEPLFYVGRGLSYRSLGQLQEARSDLHKGASMAANLFSAHYALGITEFESGNSAEAIQALSLSSTLEPANPYPYYYLGQIAEQRGDAATARQLYSTAGDLGRATSDDEVYGAALQGLQRLGD